ncbi:MAG TPA: zinc ABC transporter substrate-binding protein, partial [Thermoanaerobaculia bacterium]|nr:zinc ABC transporter substrate-binding protein [Thermoanaerobaculia bacterium]
MRGLRAGLLGIGTLCLGALALTGCRVGGPPAPCCPAAAAHAATDGAKVSAPLQVAVSVPPQAYFVERIGGSRVRVEVMIPPGYSHVDYPLTPRRMLALSRAALYVKVGHPGFEFETRQIDPFLAQQPGVKVIDMSRGMR